VKSACYRDIEAVIGAEALLWSASSNFPKTRLAAGMAHPERPVIVHPVQTQPIIFVEVVAGERTSEGTAALRASGSFRRRLGDLTRVAVEGLVDHQRVRRPLLPLRTRMRSGSQVVGT
jgi:3-hydroxyacyl-CoA dehydrogenase